MAAVLGRTEVGVKKIGQTATIPTDPKARLMYYLDCICTILDMGALPNLTRLRKYRQYEELTEEETDAIVALCYLLSPDELNDKVIIQDDGMCGDGTNAFYEISAVRHNLLITNSILIGGQQRAVSKIMVYKRQWLLNNWVEPMQAFADRLARIAAGGAAPRQRQGLKNGNGAIPSYQSIPRPDHYPHRSSKCCSCTIV